MFKRYLTPLFGPEDAQGGGGSGNAAGSGSASGGSGSSTSASSAFTGSASASTGSVTSGTASEALIKAAMASEPSSGAGTGTGTAGDTTGGAGAAAGSGATSGATGQPPQAGSSAAGAAAGSEGAPDSRIQAAVRNARASILSSLGLDPNVDTRSPTFQAAATRIQQATRLMSRLATQESAKQFYEELGKHLGAPARGAEGVAAARESFKFPDADLVSQDGKVKAYSAESMPKLLEAHAQQVRETLLKELEPIINEVKGIQSTREEGQQRERTQATLNRSTTFARTLPHFKESEPQIVAALQSMNPQLRAEVGPVAAMMMAYGQVLAKSVFPTLNTSIEKRIRDEYTKEANANRGNGITSGVNGGSTGVKKDITNVDQLARHMEQLAASATT